MSAATSIQQPDIALAPVVAQTATDFHSRMGSISRQSFVYFAGAMLTAGAGYFFKIYLARRLGAEALGLYALGMTIIGFAGIFNSLGLPTAASRFVAAYTAQREFRKLVAFLRGSLSLLLAVNCVLGLLVIFAGPWLAAHFYHAPKLTGYLWAFAAIMALGAVNMLLGQVLAGYHDVARRTLITHFVGTPANIGIAIFLISIGLGLAGYLIAQIASAALVLFLMGALVWKRIPRQGSATVFFRVEREVWKFSAAACGVAGLQFVLAQADMIVLGHSVNARQVGVYAMAMALVSFVPIALDSVNQIFSPVISELHAARNHAMLQQLYSTLTKWILALTFPLALIMITFAGGLMSLFGAAFTAGAAVLAIGASAQVLNCAVGSVGYLLLMSGNEGEFLKIQASNAALLLALNILLIPRFGITGAAIATGVTTVSTNLWGLASVHRILKLLPYHAGYLKLVAAGAVCAAAVVPLSRAFRQTPRQWEVAAAGLLLAYTIFMGVMFLLGFDNEDRMLAKFAWARVERNFRRMVIA
jgi:O-antigen/teichoic acid export membrane protein